MSNKLSKKPLPKNLTAWIEFISGDEEGRKVPLSTCRTVLGRKFGDILVRDIEVSGTHVAIEYEQGEFRIVDLNSSNGTFKDQKKVRSASIEAESVVQIGNSTFQIRFDPEEYEELRADPAVTLTSERGGLVEIIKKEFIQEMREEGDSTFKIGRREGASSQGHLRCLAGPDRGKVFKLKGDKTVLGRMESDINLADPDISRKHVLVARSEGGAFLVRDLASTNGTYLNDRRITDAPLSRGDRIRLGSTILEFSQETSDA